MIIIIIVAILLTSCNRKGEEHVIQDVTPSQIQNSPSPTQITDIASEQTTEQTGSIESEHALVQTGVGSSGLGTARIDFQPIEEAYYQKYIELADKYGTHILYDAKLDNSDYYGYSYLSGVCIVDLMDFNGDGIQDLFVVYSNGQMDRVFIDNSKYEVFDFPTKEAYEIEIWTYIGGTLNKILHEPRVSVYDSSSYSHYYPDDLINLNCRYSVAVFENRSGLPVIQILDYDERDNTCEYSNIYFSEGKIVKDKLRKTDYVFMKNGSEIPWSEWSENVAGYDKILLSAHIAESYFGLSAYLQEYCGIDQVNALIQTYKVVRNLSGSYRQSEISSWLVAEGEYISLYLKELYRSNTLLCEWEESEKVYFDHYYNLYDIDQNGIPELILYQGSSGAGTHFHFYTVIEGEIVHCGDYKRTVLLSNGEGGLIAYYARMGGYYIEKISLAGTKIKTSLIADGFVTGEEPYPELDEFEYENYQYLPFCPHSIPMLFYTYNQDLLPY